MLPEVGDHVSWISEKGLRCGTIVALYPKVETMLIKHPKAGDFYIKDNLANLRRIDFSVDRRGGKGAMAFLAV
jgi:hypothetical protein